MMKLKLGRRRMIPVSRLPRPHVCPPAGLLRSARRFGVLEAVLLVDHGGQLAVLDGHRRIAVARALGIRAVAARIIRSAR
jgi:ParB-like chromosome segregation protein Spo0J